MSCMNCDTSGDISFIKNRKLMNSINITPLQITSEISNFIGTFINTIDIKSIITQTVNIIANNIFTITNLSCTNLKLIYHRVIF